jgi:hypothetical protein
MKVDRQRHRFVFIFLAGISLLSALWTGMVRLGWTLPMPAARFPSLHGPLMITGFLGTLIGLERAAALDRYWPYGVPIFTALATLVMVAGFPVPIGASLAATGSLFLTAVFVSLYLRYPSAHFITMSLSALSWFMGNLLWLSGAPLYEVTPWWVGFLVLMIAGERLELSRVLQLSYWSRLLFFLANGIVLFGLALSLIAMESSIRLTGLGIVSLSLWLARYDIAWRTAGRAALPRFMATALLLGYLWLGIGGILWTIYADSFTAGPEYDAMLHAIFLGFVFSMIFAHAPVIFPSVTGIMIPFRNSFYLHLALLHVSLVLRILGDFQETVALRQWGGFLNVGAIFLFLANNVWAAHRGGRNHA